MSPFTPQTHFIRDSRHSFNGQRFYAETEVNEKKWYVFFSVVLTVIAVVLL